MRVDTVHSGDRDGEKGAYIINMVDEVTQYQQLASVRRITEQFMVPVLGALVGAFPFRVLGFHCHNGSEFINHRVAEMLNKLHVEDFTKSRPRRSNDNALVESKNGNVVRRWLGRSHLPESLAPDADVFLRDHLSPFLQPSPRSSRSRSRVQTGAAAGSTPRPGDDPVREASVAARSRGPS